MELSTVEIPRTKAREKAADYLRAAKTLTDPVQRREFEELAKAYKAAAAEDVALIALTPTLKAGGTLIRTLVIAKGTKYERRVNYLLPHLAVAPWRAAFVYTLGVQQDGHVEFIDSLRRRWEYQKGRLNFDFATDVPDGFRHGASIGQSTGEAWSAMVPIVPPEHRKTRMGDRLVLFEVENWEWKTTPRPPGDPALLKHIGGDLYIVEATWDLSELERLVLSGRKPQ